MKWLFKHTFSWFDIGAIAIISGSLGVWGLWALLLAFPFTAIAIIGECVTETTGGLK